MQPDQYIPAVPWKKKEAPKKILAIRLQAMGDLVITLPYLQALKKNLPPGTTIDLLTREEVQSIPKNIVLFNKVYAIGGKRNFYKQLFFAALLFPKVFFNRYDMVLDLQNNLISRCYRKWLFPKAWSQFDKTSTRAAGERTRLTIAAAGLYVTQPFSRFIFKQEENIRPLLLQNGWDGRSELVIVNPAGAFATRNWPAQSYVDFATLWLQRFPDTQFVAIGVELIANKAIFFKKELGNNFIDLVNKTNPAQAFAIMQQVKFVLTEDSGLMHMSWVSGIYTLAIFGSTRSDWSRPLGAHSLLLGSNDLLCGNCLLETCKFNDNHCITRYTPGFVFEKAMSLTGEKLHE
jgi:heptosyltransferase II